MYVPACSTLSLSACLGFYVSVIEYCAPASTRTHRLHLYFVRAAASPVELEDEQWTVYGLYERLTAQTTVYSFAGFATTYSFINPARQARPLSIRLAQLVVLPPFQRAGHGLRVLEAIHADAARDDAHEVTVESPCAGMVALRDVFILRGALRGAAPPVATLMPSWGESAPASAPTAPTSIAVLPPPPTREAALLLIAEAQGTVVEPLRAALTSTATQATRALEGGVLARLGAEWRADEEVAKRFRLWVKRRLFAGDPALQAMADVAARKAALEREFEDVYAEHIAACRALRLVDSEEAAAVAARHAQQVAEREAAEEAAEAREEEAKAAAAAAAAAAPPPTAAELMAAMRAAMAAKQQV